MSGNDSMLFDVKDVPEDVEIVSTLLNQWENLINLSYKIFL